MFKTLRFVLALFLGALALPLFSDSFAGATTGSSPQCIVSLSPTATETLFAIGAGPQVQAVDTDSDFPKTGLPTKRINALNPSVEAVLGICKSTASHPSTKPDLVVISYDANSIQQKLTNLGVKVLFQDAATSVGSALGQIRQLGQLTGHVAKAGYPQLSAEYIISANPKLIFLADTVTPASVAKRAGFSKVSAVENHNVFALNVNIASRWGPRLGILMNQLTAVVKATLNDSKLWKK
jgi:iron complex transport system substrate-binding protein